MSQKVDVVVQSDMLHAIVERILRIEHPERIILFGSRARGDARPRSDYDILVIKQSDEPRHRRSAHLYTALADLPIEVNVTMYTPQEIAEWSAVPEAFVTTAIREGRVLYEKRSQWPPWSLPD